MSNIKSISAREILSSGGAPTVEAKVILDSGVEGKASVAFGASAGSREAVTLVDGDEKRFGGKGMLLAVKNIEEKIGPALAGMEVTEQVAMDKKMLELDGTEQKSNLGGNAILAVSLAVARAGAKENNNELYEYIGKIFEIKRAVKLPKPMVVMIEGGKHADKTTDLQEYLVSALDGRTVAEMVRMEMEIYGELKKILKAEGLSVNVGNEGAFAPSGIDGNEKPMEYLVRAIEAAGYRPGIDCGISLDAAASEFAEANSELSVTNYELRVENKKLTSDELIEYYGQWIGKYPFVSWEDMLDENDWEGWVKLTEKIGGKFPNIADDLTVTNTKLWQKALEMKAASAILVKLNQAGTLTETVECCKLAREKGLWTVPSHRGGGETNDTFMVDLAVAVGAEYIKCGPTRGERVEKYNRLMEIEDKSSI
ncbi:MAG: phosphopyruvate hydratase [Candidatus Shapirobacteria bacterium]